MNTIKNVCLLLVYLCYLVLLIGTLVLVWSVVPLFEAVILTVITALVGGWFVSQVIILLVRMLVWRNNGK